MMKLDNLVTDRMLIIAFADRNNVPASSINDIFNSYLRGKIFIDADKNDLLDPASNEEIKH